MAARERILLFDVDGTLTDTQGAGSRALKRTFAETLGLDGALDGIPIAGRSDSWIVAAGLDAKGRSADAAALEEFKGAYVERLGEELERGGAYLLPGVEPLLAALAERGGAALGLGTGNFRLAAEAKLSKVGIWHYFADGGFGDDAADRAELLAASVKRLSVSGPADSADVIVIGDTPHDISAARAINARVIAVKTGYADPSELTTADWLFDDLSDTASVLAALLDGV